MYLENTSITEIVILCKYSRQAIHVKHWAIQIMISAAHDCREASCHRKQFYQQPMIVRGLFKTEPLLLTAHDCKKSLLTRKLFYPQPLIVRKHGHTGSIFISNTWPWESILREVAALSTTHDWRTSFGTKHELVSTTHECQEVGQTLSTTHDHYRMHAISTVMFCW